MSYYYYYYYYEEHKKFKSPTNKNKQTCVINFSRMKDDVDSTHVVLGVLMKMM